MMAALRDAPEVTVVWGTRDPAMRAPLKERARAMVRRLFGSDTTRAHPDSAMAEADLHAGVVVLLGGPRENLWSARLAPGLPVSFEPRGFRWQGRLYDRPGEAIHLVYPNPLAPDRFLMLVAGNSAAALARRGGGFFFGAEDWRIYRDGEIVRSGRFAQDPGAPWRYDPALDRDRDRERERFTASLAVRRLGPLELRAPAGLAAAAGAEADAESLDRRLAGLGLPAPRGQPFRLTLFSSLEQKGALTRSTRVEELDPTGTALAALPAGRRALDLWSLAAQRLVMLGASPANPWLEPAGAWCAQRWGGEPLPAAVARLYFGRLLPTAAEAAARPVAWRSPLIEVPARALLVGAVLDLAGPARRGGLLAMLGAQAPGTLDSLCRLIRAAEPRVAACYAALADSIARAGEGTLRASGPRAWRPADGFMRGVCLTHAVSLEHGYLSAECDHELGSLAALGCGWVSLTPFGYLPGRDVPEILPGAEGGPDEENDEAVCEAAAHASARGLRVWLKPHLWARGWVGDLEFGASDWPRFFSAYRAFLLHYALLADRERLDGLTVGHELASTSRRFPDRWRALIGDVRRVYRGSLTYDANWDEAGSVSFWDALDVIGVSFYRPLSKAPTRDASTLRAGARQALQGLAPLAARWHRPVLIAEVGYAPTVDAPVRPWEERSGPVDLETQRACYEAVVQAMEDQPWLAGAFWWKWFSSAEEGGAGDASYSPRGKPAEAVLRSALDRWRHRVVAVPGRPGSR
jgi:hypothetical protein